LGQLERMKEKVRNAEIKHAKAEKAERERERELMLKLV
jgi:hypothetical protein